MPSLHLSLFGYVGRVTYLFLYLGFVACTMDINTAVYMYLPRQDIETESKQCGTSASRKTAVTMRG